MAESFTPIALIGAGGIGKTSVALTVLHGNRVERRFGNNRWFIRCDQFPSSRGNFLRRFSYVIGAGIENPGDLAALRPFLSSREMFVVLDNAESILDPRGTDAQEIYNMVEELSHFSNICLCITSRISTVPPNCEILDIPILSMEAAADTFYRIYKRGERSDTVNNVLKQLDFHPLSITLLATVAHQNRWSTDRLFREWERQHTGILQTEHNKSLAAAIELSLTSPMFRELGADAKGLLGVIAFFPQGVDEKNLEWLFPTISNGLSMFDKFCILSLTYRSNGFITMLAPLRDRLRPIDPTSSPLLDVAKERYFARLSVVLNPNTSDFAEAQWITSEDVNIEHLLDVFTSINADSENVWDACADFMDHLYWQKPRLVVLGPKIEALPDDYPSKPRCLKELSWLFYSIGNQAECRRLLTHALELWRERGDDSNVAQILGALSDANVHMGLLEEGIQQAKEASEIFERLDDPANQAVSLIDLALLFRSDEQFDAAEEAASRAIELLPEKGQQFLVCKGHRTLGSVYHSRGDTEKAIHHLEVALEIATPFGWDSQLFWIRYTLARVFFGEGKFDDAHTQIERAESHALDNAYELGRAVELQASFWYDQGKFERAKVEATRAADLYGKVGATKDIEDCRGLLRKIDELDLGSVGEFLQMLLPALINVPLQGQETE